MLLRSCEWLLTMNEYNSNVQCIAPISNFYFAGVRRHLAVPYTAERCCGNFCRVASLPGFQCSRCEGEHLKLELVVASLPAATVRGRILEGSFCGKGCFIFDGTL